MAERLIQSSIPGRRRPEQINKGEIALVEWEQQHKRRLMTIYKELEEKKRKKLPAAIVWGNGRYRTFLEGRAIVPKLQGREKEFEPSTKLEERRLSKPGLKCGN